VLEMLGGGAPNTRFLAVLRAGAMPLRAAEAALCVRTKLLGLALGPFDAARSLGLAEEEGATPRVV
jgi:hypothetical protein